jgi:hypothetical protein
MADNDRLTLVGDDNGNHGNRLFADIYLGTTPIGGLFCSKEHFSVVEKALSLYNKALDEAPTSKE